MSESKKATPLYLHTLKTLCDELVSGRAVEIDKQGNEFRLNSKEARSLFSWYLKNQNKWAGNVTKQDVEALADQLEIAPPELPENINAKTEGGNRTIHLKTVRVHRFAGIHRYGKPSKPPDDFYFEFEKPLTLIEGMNGAGKTSLLSAITWCLTGYVYRSQRPPEIIQQSIPLKIVSDSGDTASNTATYEMAAITPIPPAEILRSLRGEPLPLDTWVEVTLIDENGQILGNFRRGVQRSPRGKMAILSPDFSTIGLDPISLEIGTKMPGLIPYIQLGTASDLGKAVAGITGIKPLQDLAKHATKSQAKLGKDLVKDRQEEIAKIDQQFLEARKKLSDIIQSNPSIDPKKELPNPGPDKSIESELTKLKDFFENLQSSALSEASTILGTAFNPEDRTAREDLGNNVGPALGLLDVSNIRRLPSASRLAGLGALTPEEISSAEVVIESLKGEATEIAKLEIKPDVATRLRLYAKVASWIKDAPEQHHDFAKCPVCQGVITNKYDPVTRRSISDHIQECLKSQSAHLEKSLKTWKESAKATLSKALPENLRMEMTRDLPDKPIDLIFSALTEELFESKHFSGCLISLKSIARKLCEEELSNLKPFVEPEEVTLPGKSTDGRDSLSQSINRVNRALAFARWRKANDAECRGTFSRIVGMTKSAESKAQADGNDIESPSLSQCLRTLDQMVKGITPLTIALTEVKAMADKLAERRQRESRLTSYAKTADAITELINIGDLVEKQVSFLLSKLLSKTLEWREQLYLPAFTNSPEVVYTDVASDGTLIMEAAAEGTKASAHHISNASDLRATLLSFLIAFWQYLLQTRGGLSLFLMDDLQELFDRDNRRRVANTIPSILNVGGRVLITTNDTQFGERVTVAVSEKIGHDKADRRRIHTLNTSRQHIELGLFKKTIDEKRSSFEKPENQNEAQPARDYIKDLRIYLENRLIDFLDVPDSGLPTHPTFSDMITAVRSRRRKGLEAFSGQAFSNLVSDPALNGNSEFLTLMNQSHHKNEDDISFNAVYRVREECIRAQRLIEAAHEEYERWLRRDSRDTVVRLPSRPDPIKTPTFSVPVIMDLAAFTTDTPMAETVESEDPFSGGWFENCALYLINTHNFGFAASPNCRAVVDLSDRPVVDKMLVIAIHKDRVYARRLLRDNSRPTVAVLASEAENPMKRPPSLILPFQEVLLLNVVGVLFDHRPHFPRPTQEALLMDSLDFIEDVQVVFRVRGDSAIPLALPDQSILGGRRILNSQLDELYGTPVAVATSEGSAFKKIGKSIPGAPHVRQFESIGGLGESILVRTEDIQDSFGNLPLLLSIRRVLGVLYTQIKGDWTA
jgi:hypothetical protein